VLVEIFGSQIASSTETKKTLTLKGNEEIGYRKKVRKRYEYRQRRYTQGKIPKEKSLDKEWSTPAHVSHRAKDISSLNLWDLYVTLKKAQLSPIHENLRLILKDFLNVFMKVESIKRELSRIRNDPTYQKHMREYVGFKIRSRKFSKSP